jgi:uncharacterized cupin superfamily protein
MSEPRFALLDPALPLEVWHDFPESEVCSGTRASIGRLLLDDPAAGLKVGLWEAEANLGRWMDWPCDEFMVIVEGEVVMVEADRETVISAGECFYIPKGRRCIWNQAGYVKKIMVLFEGGAADGSRPIRKIDPATPLSLVGTPSGTGPQQAFAELLSDMSGRLSIGVWQSSAYSRPDRMATETEVMHILSGQFTLSDPGGAAQVFGPGDTILVPAGATTAWSSQNEVRKIYCSCGPA